MSSNFVEMHLLTVFHTYSSLLVRVNMQCCLFLYILHPPIMCLPYIKVVGNGVTHRMKCKRICPQDSAGTYSAVEGPSPPAKSTNIVSPDPPAAASASTVRASQRVTRSFAQELASSQAAFTPNTTSEALLTQQDLARSDEPHEHQHQDGT